MASDHKTRSERRPWRPATCTIGRWPTRIHGENRSFPSPIIFAYTPASLWGGGDQLSVNYPLIQYTQKSARPCAGNAVILKPAFVASWLHPPGELARKPVPPGRFNVFTARRVIGEALSSIPTSTDPRSRIDRGGPRIIQNTTINIKRVSLNWAARRPTGLRRR
jgi:hypothetical protein